MQMTLPVKLLSPSTHKATIYSAFGFLSNLLLFSLNKYVSLATNVT